MTKQKTLMQNPINSSFKVKDVSMVCEVIHEPDSASQIEPEMTPQRSTKPYDTVSPEVEFGRADSNQTEILGEMGVSPQKPDQLMDTMMPKVEEEDDESDNDERQTHCSVKEE